MDKPGASEAPPAHTARDRDGQRPEEAPECLLGQMPEWEAVLLVNPSCRRDEHLFAGHVATDGAEHRTQPPTAHGAAYSICKEPPDAE